MQNTEKPTNRVTFHRQGRSSRASLRTSLESLETRQMMAGDLIGLRNFSAICSVNAAPATPVVSANPIVGRVDGLISMVNLTNGNSGHAHGDTPVNESTPGSKGRSLIISNGQIELHTIGHAFVQDGAQMLTSTHGLQSDDLPEQNFYTLPPVGTVHSFAAGAINITDPNGLSKADQDVSHVTPGTGAASVQLVAVGTRDNSQTSVELGSAQSQANKRLGHSSDGSWLQTMDLFSLDSGDRLGVTKAFGGTGVWKSHEANSAFANPAGFLKTATLPTDVALTPKALAPFSPFSKQELTDAALATLNSHAEWLAKDAQLNAALTSSNSPFPVGGKTSNPAGVDAFMADYAGDLPTTGAPPIIKPKKAKGK